VLFGYAVNLCGIYISATALNECVQQVEVALLAVGMKNHGAEADDRDGLV